MIRVIGHFRLPAGQLDAAREPMRRVVAETLMEAGCLGYSYAEDVCEPGLIRVSEAWERRDQLDAHLQSPHMLRWRTEREALGLYDRQIVVVENGCETPL